MKKIRLLPIVLTMVFSLCACNSGTLKEPQPTLHASEKDTLFIPQAGNTGGYIFKNNKIRTIVFVDSENKYVEIEKARGEKIAYYKSAHEMIVVTRIGDIVKHHTQPLKDTTEKNPNPLIRIFDNLRKLEFTPVKEKDGHFISEFTQEQNSVVPVKYLMHTTQLRWIDGREYTFHFFEYDDGATLISMEAPKEINPMITKDTPWVVDIENCVMRNTKTGETVAFAIKSTVQKEGISPNGNETATSRQNVTVTVVSDGEQIQSVEYKTDAIHIGLDILNRYDYAKPQIPEDSVEMTAQELEMALLQVYTMESIF